MRIFRDKKICKKIESLESSLGVELPKTYIDFLLNLGRAERRALVGSDFEIEDILDNNDGLLELLKVNDINFALPKHYLCFLMHQGYIAFWVDLDSGEDPVVWNYSEGTTEKPRKLEKLSMFIPSIIKEWGNA